MSIALRFHIQRGEFALNIDTVIPGSGVTAICGPSGSGKTTLLRAIAGLEYTEDGYLKVGDILMAREQNLPTHAPAQSRLRLPRTQPVQPSHRTR